MFFQNACSNEFYSFLNNTTVLNNTEVTERSVASVPVRLETNSDSRTMTSMALIQVSQISFESEVCGVKRRYFYNKSVNK